MEFGIPREQRAQEGRVALTPAGVGALVAAGHRVWIEHEAGAAAGFEDEAYRRNGAQVVYGAAEAYGRAEVVAKVARPTAAEHRFFMPGQLLFSFLHLAVASPDLLAALQGAALSAVAWELVATPEGRHPVLDGMSHIAARLAPVIAGGLLQTGAGGRGLLLGGLAGVPPATVVVLGAGELGREAARSFARQGSHVVVLDQRLEVLRLLDAQQSAIVTMLATPESLRQAVAFADVLVGAVALAGQRAPTLVTRAMLRTMKPGAVILDFAVDSGGCVETTRPTTHADPTFVAEGVLHYAVPSVPAAVARTASHALTNATLPLLLALGDGGRATLREAGSLLASGLVLDEGRVAHAAIARALGQAVAQ